MRDQVFWPLATAVETGPGQKKIRNLEKKVQFAQNQAPLRDTLVDRAMSTLLEAVNSKGYAHPESLVTTEWLAEHLTDPDLRIIESNEDPLLFASGHIPGAIEVDWIRDLNDPVRRDYISREGFQALMRKLGATEKTTFVFYGDKNNWWATYALWVFTLFGLKNLKVVDGGRLKWIKEGREVTRSTFQAVQSEFVAGERDDKTDRAFRSEVLDQCEAKGQLVDVRSVKEYTGERLHMDDYPNEGALRGGHIPGAKSVPWSSAVNPEDGTFKTAKELESTYIQGAGLDRSKPATAYCRIGERSSHTWFVLKHLLGFKEVQNYDGSWTEWGNSVGLPVEKGL